MTGAAPMQEDYGAYRYQLAYMAYVLALTHYHRLPAAPAAFHGTFVRLIDKMLLPEVWLYWRNAASAVARSRSICRCWRAALILSPKTISCTAPICRR